MNTKSIQEKHPEVYKEMFGKCDIVCSVPMCINWGTECASIPGGMGIFQKLPLRIYVGLEKTKSDDNKIFDFTIYLPENDDFVKYNVSDQLISNLKSALQFLKLDDNYRIHILSEYNFNRGIYGYGSMSVCLATALYLLKNKITPEIIEIKKKLDSGKFDITASNNDLILPELFAAAYAIMVPLMDYVSAPNTIMVSFFNGNMPFLVQNQPIKDEMRYLKKYDPEIVYNYIKNLQYFCLKFSNIIKFKENKLPIDFLLMYWGKEQKVMHEDMTRIKAFDSVEKNVEFIKQYGNEIFPSNYNNSKYLNLKNFTLQDYIQIYRAMAIAVTMDIISNFELMNKDYDKYSTDFFYSQGKDNYVAGIFDQFTDNFQKTMREINEWLSHRVDKKYACRTQFPNEIFLIGERPYFQLLVDEL